MDGGNLARLGAPDRNALRRETTRRPALERARPVGDRGEKTWKTVSRTGTPSEFEDEVGRGHLRVSAAGAGAGRDARAALIADLAEVLELDAHAALAIEEILCPEAAEEGDIAELAARTARPHDKTFVVKGQSCLGKEPPQSTVDGEVPGERDGRYQRNPHARHFVGRILGDPPTFVLVMKFTDYDIAQLGPPVPVDLMADEPFEAGIVLVFRFVEGPSGAEV